MASEIGKTFLERSDILLLERVARHAAMHLERAHRRHHHRRIGLEPGLAAFDVEEFFGAQISAEPGLGHDEIGELERCRRRDHRVAAMSDIAERAAMDKSRVIFQRLHEVGRERVLEQSRH